MDGATGRHSPAWIQSREWSSWKSLPAFSRRSWSTPVEHSPPDERHPPRVAYLERDQSFDLELRLLLETLLGEQLVQPQLELGGGSTQQ